MKSCYILMQLDTFNFYNFKHFSCNKSKKYCWSSTHSFHIYSQVSYIKKYIIKQYIETKYIKTFTNIRI